MDIKIIIKKDSEAAKVMKEFMAEKQRFKKAIEEGKVNEYVKDKQIKVVQPL